VTGRCAAGLALLLACLAAVPARAAEWTGGVTAEYWTAARVDDRGRSLSRFALRPSVAADFGYRWRGELELRAEWAKDDTGLGTTETYASASRPLVDDRDRRVEIDRAVLEGRFGATVLTLGKQTVPWGVLDGIQVTDRFDAVRRRDFLFTEVRPERLARWGARLRTRAGGWRAELALALDGTVSQQALPGDAFALRAPRFRLGLPVEAPTPPLRVDRPEHDAGDATVGLRLGRRFGAMDATVLVLDGPETDPVLRPDPAGGGGILLAHPRRTLVGFTLEGSSGRRVWRLEAAHVPNQPVNLRPEAGAPLPFTDELRARTLLGVALDWNAPGGVFVNLQLVGDHTAGAGARLHGPRHDLVGTLRLQRSFARQTVRASLEVLGSLTDRDRAVRPELRWRVTDAVALAAGADLIQGTRRGLFGQFRDESRGWLRATLTL
jgi:hypothetical protein